MTGELRGYVLAGGRSSRMGVDKAELELGGRTLLEIAVGKLRGICGEVVVIGPRRDLPPGVRRIDDLHGGCGPIGGMEAALRDLGSAAAAVFLPVDMPLLPAGLFSGLVEAWLSSAAAAAFALVDGRAQPLVSLLRAAALPEIERTLERGERKVRPVLERAGAGGPGGITVPTPISTLERRSVWPGWLPSDDEWSVRELWFANLNTPEEFARAELMAETLKA